MQASREAKVCSSVLQAERNDEAVWNALLDRAMDIAALQKINPSAPEEQKCSNTKNVEANTPSAFWKREVNIQFLDLLVS